MQPYLFRLLPFFTALLFSLRPAAAQDSTALRKERHLQTEIFDHLSDECFRPSIDDEGDIVFTEKGTTYWIHLTTDAAGAGTRLIFATSFRLPKGTKLKELPSVCNYLNRNLYTFKVYYDLNRRNVGFAVETWIQNSSDFTKLFTTYLVGLQAAVATVFDKIE